MDKEQTDDPSPQITINRAEDGFVIIAEWGHGHEHIDKTYVSPSWTGVVERLERLFDIPEGERILDVV